MTPLDTRHLSAAIVKDQLQIPGFSGKAHTRALTRSQDRLSSASSTSAVAAAETNGFLGVSPPLHTENPYEILGETVISDDSEEEDTSMTPPKKQGATKVRLPPIYIMGLPVADIFRLLGKCSITSSADESFLLKQTKDSVQFLTKAKTLFDKTMGALKAEGIQFFTHGIAAKSPTKFVLSGLPPVEISELKDDLSANGIQPLDVKLLTTTKTAVDERALYLLYFERGTTKIQDLRKTKGLLGMVVSWRFFTKRPTDAAQCHRCQRFGHGSSNCNLTPKCVKCGDVHNSDACKLPKKANLNNNNNARSQLKCANCGGSHTANFRGCPSRKAYLEAVEKRKKKPAGRPPPSGPPPLTPYTFPTIDGTAPPAPRPPTTSFRTGTYARMTGRCSDRLNQPPSADTLGNNLFTISEFLCLARDMFMRFMDRLNHLKIVNWNGRSILPKHVEFFDFLVSHKIDVAAVSETWLKQTNSFYHPDYRCIREDRRSTHHERGGGVLIAVRKGIQFSRLSISTATIEAVGIELLHDSQPVHIIAAYFPGCHRGFAWSSFRRDILTLTRRSVPFFVAGDLNARHRQWNCAKANKAGNILANCAASSNFFIHAPGSFTYHPNGSRRPSTLDLVLSNNLIDMSSLSVVNDLSSDHLPVRFDINISVPYNPTGPLIRCYARANWQLFQRVLNDKIDLTAPVNATLDSPEAIDRCVDNFSCSIREAEAAAVPNIPAKTYEAVKTPASTVLLIRLRNARRRQYFRCRNGMLPPIIDSLNKRIREECSKARNQKFSETVRNLGKGANDVWRISKALRNTVKYSPPLQRGSTLVASPEEKANLLAECFAASHRNPMSADSITSSEVEDSIRNITNATLGNAPLVRPRELERIFKALKAKKAPGQDGIRNILLKRLPRKGLVLLTNITNACLKLGHFPSKWKHAVVTAIPKAGKDITLPTNYRPISLLSTMSKVLERVVLNRIENHLIDRDIIPLQQFGFKRGHSTNHQLTRLTKNIRDSFNRRHSAGMVLLDVEKAYDSVWQDAILHKMLMANFPLHILRILHSFLKNRSFQVAINGVLSSRQQIPFGVPQGAVLSPILYNIFMSDVVMVDGVEYYLFADDTGYVATGSNPTEVTAKLQSAQNALEAYQKRWRVKVNAAKTQTIFFTRRRCARYLPQTPITVMGQNIPWSDHVKYLGLILDQKLKFDKHVSASLEKSDRLTKMLYPLVCRRSRLNKDNKLLLYKLIYRPTLMYGFPAWHSCAQSRKNKLQIRQNKILKMMLDLPFNFPTNELGDASNVELLEPWTSKILQKFWSGCALSENHLITNLVP